MVVATELILTLVMVGISIFLIRTILVIRDRRFRFSSEGEDDYSGDAKDPQPSPIQTQMLWKKWILFWKGPVSPC